jgi:hypothetical protein
VAPVPGTDLRALFEVHAPAAAAAGVAGVARLAGGLAGGLARGLAGGLARGIAGLACALNMGGELARKQGRGVWKLFSLKIGPCEKIMLSSCSRWFPLPVPGIIYISFA